MMTMVDYDGYSSSRQGMEETRMDDSMMCDSHDGEWEEETCTHKRSTALAAPSMASRYGPAEMEGALRIMTHAGRILWRAAMEAIPGASGSSYNPSLRVLSKLFQRSFGKRGYNTNSSSSNTDENESEYEHDNATTRRKVLPFSWGNILQGSGSGTPDHQDHGGTEDLDDVMEVITDYSSSDSVSASTFSSSWEPTDGERLSQPQKRKTRFGISALLPSVVSDSEEDEEEEEEVHVRPSKRVRRSFDNEPLVRCW